MKEKCDTCIHRCNKCLEIALTRPADKHYTSDTLCWCCKNAVPKKDEYDNYITGCSWSIKAIPVNGWQYSKKTITYYDDKAVYTYLVTSCPKFERG